MNNSPGHLKIAKIYWTDVINTSQTLHLHINFNFKCIVESESVTNWIIYRSLIHTHFPYWLRTWQYRGAPAKLKQICLVLRVHCSVRSTCHRQMMTSVIKTIKYFIFMHSIWSIFLSAIKIISNWKFISDFTWWGLDSIVLKSSFIVSCTWGVISYSRPFVMSIQNLS